MLNNWRDTVSRFASAATNAILLDAPKKTGYGFVLGLFLYVVEILGTRMFHLTPSMAPWELITVGVFIVHARSIWRHIVGKPAIGEKHEEQLELIRRAALAGLSESHVRTQLYELCRQALKETSLSVAARQELDALEIENRGK